MFDFMVTADGGLTTAGYVITIIAGIVLFFLAIYLAGKNSQTGKSLLQDSWYSVRWLLH